MGAMLVAGDPVRSAFDLLDADVSASEASIVGQLADGRRVLVAVEDRYCGDRMTEAEMREQRHDRQRVGAIGDVAQTMLDRSLPLAGERVAEAVLALLHELDAVDREAAMDRLREALS